MIRVLQAIAGAEFGGAELFFGALILAMDQYPNPPVAISQQALMRPYETRLNQLAKGGIPVKTLQFGSWFDWRSKHVLRETMNDFRPHIVQSWMNRATKFIPPRHLCQSPFVHVGWLGGYHDMKYYAACDHIVALTGDMRRHAVAAGFAADRVHVIPPFAMLSPTPPVTRAQFQTPEDAPLIVSTARLHVRKAQDVLLRAMVEIPHAYLWLVGEGDLRKPLTKLCEDLGIASRVRFLGWRNDHLSLLQHADLFVLPSRYEPFGIVLLEAWSRQVPVVTTTAQGPKSIVTHDQDGLLVPIDDVGSLVDAMRSVLADTALRQKLIANANQTFAAKYSRESVVRRYYDLYQQLAMLGTYAHAA